MTILVGFIFLTVIIWQFIFLLLDFLQHFDIAGQFGHFWQAIVAILFPKIVSVLLAANNFPRVYDRKEIFLFHAFCNNCRIIVFKKYITN